MKAVVCPAYGSPEVLRVENVPKPVPKDSEILVQIMASAVNTADVLESDGDVKSYIA
jgi:NADPH:quinone reductase-like Zn-dependent oxidoreductase